MHPKSFYLCWLFIILLFHFKSIFSICFLKGFLICLHLLQYSLKCIQWENLIHCLLSWSPLFLVSSSFCFYYLLLTRVFSDSWLCPLKSGEISLVSFYVTVPWKCAFSHCSCFLFLVCYWTTNGCPLRKFPLQQVNHWFN